MGEILTEEEIKELLERVPKQWYLFEKGSNDIKKLKKMTAEEIKVLLEKNEYVNYKDDNGVTYYKEIAPFYKEFDDYVCFIGYPYTIEPPEYDYAFSIYVDKNTSEISRSSAPIDPIELRKMEKEIGINKIKPYEDTIKTINDARNILEKSKLILGEKRSDKEYKGIMFYYKLGQFFCEYEDMFSFIGYPYNSKDNIINYEKKTELLIEKWRGKIAILTEYLSNNEKDNIIKVGIEYIDPEYDSVRYSCIKELKKLM